MLTKHSREPSEGNHFSADQSHETLVSVAPDEIGIEETVRILTTKSHKKVALTAAQKKAEEKFFRTIYTAERDIDGTADASENHDKYIYGRRGEVS